jgi:zinc D-Ala-D-Ala dipeptidase
MDFTALNGPRRLGRVLMLAAAIVLAQTDVSTGEAALPDGFTYLRDIDPTIAQDMKYAGSDNFTGRPLPGYDGGECVLLRRVAEALRRVQQDLLAQGLSLKVYDCYRPVRAVRAMMSWASEPRRADENRAFHPRIARNQLVLQGYIASKSGHSRGIAIDLTLVRASGAHEPEPSRDPCAGSAQTANDPDMGTGFDCFDVKSHTAHPSITPDQRRWRTILERAMAKHGFKNYPREWWHFTHGSPPAEAADFPIRARTVR